MSNQQILARDKLQLGVNSDAKARGWANVNDRFCEQEFEHRS